MERKRTTLTVNALYQKCGDQISDCTNGGVTSKNSYFIIFNRENPFPLGDGMNRFGDFLSTK